MKHDTVEVRTVKQTESAQENKSVFQTGNEIVITISRQPVEQYPETMIRDAFDTRPFYQKFGNKKKKY